MVASWWPCCCSDPVDCNCSDCQVVELDITGATFYDGTSSVIQSQTIGTWVLSPYNLVGWSTCSTATDLCTVYKGLAYYSATNPGSHPSNNCNGDQLATGTASSEFYVRFYDDGKILIEHVFSVAENVLGYVRTHWMQIWQIDSADASCADLFGSGIDLSNAYTIALKTAVVIGTCGTNSGFSCSSGTYNEPYHSITGTLKATHSYTNSICTWRDSGTAASYLDNWSLTGLNNTNSDCGKLYGSYQSNDTGTSEDCFVKIYSDSGRTALVASFVTDVSNYGYPSAASATLTEQNSSGLSGSVDFQGQASLTTGNFELWCG